MKKYELIEFKVPDQNLTKEEVLSMLFCNEISVFDLVQGEGDVMAMSIHSHPDFADREDKRVFCMDLSIRAREVLMQVRDQKAKDLQTVKEGQAQKSNGITNVDNEIRDFVSNKSAKVPVLIRADVAHLSGLLIKMTANEAFILLTSPLLRLNQQIHFSIVKRGGGERFDGKVLECTERPDPQHVQEAKKLYVYTVQI